MNPLTRVFRWEYPDRRLLHWGDAVIFLLLAALVYLGLRLGLGSPEVIKGPEISLSPEVLPYYAGLSVGRMTAAYALSIVFTFVYGSLAAKRPGARKVLIPLLDVLQSVPILSFLPVVLLSFSAVLPARLAVELSSVVLIFTSQVWNLTFAWYQSLTTIPRDLQEAATIFRFNGWQRFKTLELPFAAITLIWNSMMSWAGGWFFLMAAEIFTAGERDFRLIGLGAYLQEAANRGDISAILWGLGTLVLTIVILDQLVWRPLVAWSDRFKLQLVEGESQPASWFFEAVRGSWLTNAVARLLRPVARRLDEWLTRRFPFRDPQARGKARGAWLWYAVGALAGILLLNEIYRAGLMLWGISFAQWKLMVTGVTASMLRVAAALAIALAWTLPLGVAIGTNRRVAVWLQPLVQIAASVPATALFPIVLLAVLRLPGGLNVAAVLLMLLGTQWYLLFNIIAGASAIPQDLQYTSALLRLSRWQRWRTLILPALMPYLVTGAITASGGAWNATIVAEYVHFGGETLQTTGIGALIAGATAAGDYPLLLAATLSMILAVSTINRLVWRRLYRLAEERYRLD